MTAQNKGVLNSYVILVIAFACSGEPKEEIIPAEQTEADSFRITYLNVNDEESNNGVSWRWSKGKSASIQFINPEPSNALEISYWIPYSVYAANNPTIESEVLIEVYFNGELYQRQPCIEDSAFTVNIASELLLPNQINTVEIRSPYSFWLDDARGESSFQILNARIVE